MDEKTWRNEIKYVCSDGELALVEHAVRHICRLDAHADQDGAYRVRSLYFDDYEDSCFRENENGVTPRKKYRIRVYNGDPGRIFMECKYKRRDMTRKDSCRITGVECRELMQGRFWALGGRQEAPLRYFCAEMALRVFSPKVIVQYERTAYVYPVGNVRITFDRNIAMSGRNKDFLESCLPVRPVMPGGRHVLEVKYNGILPDFIYNALHAADLRQTNFSKYYISRRLQMGGQR